MEKMWSWAMLVMDDLLLLLVVVSAMVLFCCCCCGGCGLFLLCRRNSCETRHFLYFLYDDGDGDGEGQKVVRRVGEKWAIWSLYSRG